MHNLPWAEGHGVQLGGTGSRSKKFGGKKRRGSDARSFWIYDRRTSPWVPAGPAPG